MCVLIRCYVRSLSTFNNRPQFETDRQLDRSECRITQYWNETEIVMPLFRVLQKATASLEHVFAPLVVRVDVSGKHATHGYVDLLNPNWMLTHTTMTQLPDFVPVKLSPSKIHILNGKKQLEAKMQASSVQIGQTWW